MHLLCRSSYSYRPVRQAPPEKNYSWRARYKLNTKPSLPATGRGPNPLRVMAAYQRVHGNAAGPRHASMAECNGVIDQPGRTDGHEGNFSTTRVTANHGPLAMPFKSIDFSSAVAYAHWRVCISPLYMQSSPPVDSASNISVAVKIRWRPLLPYAGYSYKASSCARSGL